MKLYSNFLNSIRNNENFTSLKWKYSLLILITFSLITFVLAMFFTSSRLSEKEKVLIELNKRAEIHFSEMKKANDEIKKNESIFDKNDRLRECTFEQIQRVLDGKSIQLSFCERKIEQEDAEDSDVQESNDFSFFWIPQASADWDDITYKGLKKNSKKVPPFKLYSQLKDECIRQEVKNPKHCIKVWLSIAYAESSWKDLKTPFGLQSEDKSFKKWVSSYKKFWYKAKNGAFFYGSNGKKPKSHYCLSEESSGTTGRCPNWQRNFDEIFKGLKF